MKASKELFRLAFTSVLRRGGSSNPGDPVSSSSIPRLLIQPQLQSFVFKGLNITASEVEEGAQQAVDTIYTHFNSNEHDLRPIIEPQLFSILTANGFPPEPALKHIEKVTLDHVRVVVGGQRDSYLQQPATAEEEGKEEREAGKQISSITPTCIGRDMVILSRDADFEGVPNFFRKFLFLDYTEQYMQTLLVEHGMTIQIAVNVNCVLAGPLPGSADNSPECIERWVFESPMDHEFKRELDLRVVDVNTIMKGGEFWEVK